MDTGAPPSGFTLQQGHQGARGDEGHLPPGVRAHELSFTLSSVLKLLLGGAPCSQHCGLFSVGCTPATRFREVRLGEDQGLVFRLNNYWGHWAACQGVGDSHALE